MQLGAWNQHIPKSCQLGVDRSLRVECKPPANLRRGSMLRQPTLPHGRHQDVIIVQKGQQHASFTHGGAQDRRHAMLQRCHAATATAQGLASPAEVSIEREELPGCKVRLRVEVPSAMVRKAYERALKEARQKLSVPGFRKGKQIPDDVMVQHLGGQQEVNHMAIEQIMQDIFSPHLQGYMQNVVRDSFVIEGGRNALVQAFDPAKPFVYYMTFDIVPPIKWKIPYRDIKVEVELAGDARGDDAEAAKQLTALRKSKGILRIAAGRSLRRGDVAIINFAATRVDNGAAVLGADRKGMQLDTGTPEDTLNLPGVVEGMEGMRVGEERSVRVTIPDTWTEPASMAGVAVTCDIKLKELFEWELPEVSDEWAEGVMSGCGGAAGLRKEVAAAVAGRTEARSLERLVTALREAVASAVDAPIPGSVLRDIGRQEYQAHLHELQMKAQLVPAQIEQLATPEMLNKYIESKREFLETLQLSTWGFEDIFQREALAIDDAAVEEEFKQVEAEFGAAQQEFDAERLREQIVEFQKAAKVVAWLKENCDIKLLPPSKG